MAAASRYNPRLLRFAWQRRCSHVRYPRKVLQPVQQSYRRASAADLQANHITDVHMSQWQLHGMGWLCITLQHTDTCLPVVPRNQLADLWQIWADAICISVKTNYSVLDCDEERHCLADCREEKEARESPQHSNTCASSTKQFDCCASFKTDCACSAGLTSGCNVF